MQKAALRPLFALDRYTGPNSLRDTGLLRLIHTADWQIGREYGSFATDDAAALASARLDTVKRIGEVATAAQADLIVVAGDVFDAPSIADKTMRRLFAALETFAGEWILLPGNHDPALSVGVWARATELGCVPSNAHVISKTTLLDFAGLNTSVLAAPLTQRNTLSDMTGQFDAMASEAGRYRIGVAHGSVSGLLQESADAGNPIAPDRAETAGLDYLALGDWHGMKQVNARTWYSGTPEQDRFRGNEPGHILQVSIERPGQIPVVEARRVGKYQWHDVKADLHGESALTELTRQLETFGDADVLQLTLSGSLTLGERRELDAVLDSHGARLRAFRHVESDLSTSASDEDIALLQVDGYLAQVLADLRGPDHGLTEAVRQQALRLLADEIIQHTGARS